MEFNDQESSYSPLSFAITGAIYGAILLGFFIAGFFENENAKNESTPSQADPILLMLGGKDPTKDAGLVGKERGVAKGTKDGDPLFDPGKFDLKELEKIQQQNEAEAREQEAREREEAAKKPAAEPPKQSVPAEEAPKNSVAAPEKTPSETPKNSAETSPAKTVSVADFLKQKGKSNSQKSTGTTPKKNLGNGSGKRIEEVKIGNGKSGNGFGTPSGTGGNGGDGGARVADERAIYAAAVSARFKEFFEEIVAQEPVSLTKTITVSARFSVDGNGTIRFLEVQGSSNPEVIDRIKKTFQRAFPTKFQRPPRGESFVGRLENITFVIF